MVNLTVLGDYRYETDAVNEIFGAVVFAPIRSFFALKRNRHATGYSDGKQTVTQLHRLRVIDIRWRASVTDIR